MDKNEAAKVRRKNLVKWFEERSIPDNEKSYISQLINGKAAFGEKAARRLERDYGMGLGYLDGNIHTSGSEEVSAIFDSLDSETKRQEFIELARLFAKYNIKNN